MCLVKHTLEVCPSCPNQPKKGSPNKLYQNERETNISLQTCDNATGGKSCFPRQAQGGIIQEIWLCEKDSKGQDLRIVKSCTRHGIFESSEKAWERKAKVLEKENRKAAKHPKVIKRQKGITGVRSSETEASYEILRALGIEGKAALEYDNPKELEDAQRMDDKHDHGMTIQMNSRLTMGRLTGASGKIWHVSPEGPIVQSKF